jgi:CBS domain-containing protein
MVAEMTVQQLLEAKDSKVYSIAPEATVFDALKILREAKIGALLVLEQGKLAGVFSERDYARRIILEGRTSRDTPIREVMTSSVFCVSPEQTVKECMALMNKKRCRHLPVLKGEVLIGVVSIGDVVRTVLMSLFEGKT